MAEVKNNSRGPRTVQEKFGDGARTVFIGRGETVEVDLVSVDDPVLRGMMASGDLSVDGSKPEDFEVSREGDDPKFAANPMERANKEAADAAGKTEGLASQPPKEEDEKPAPKGKAKAKGE